MDGKAGLRRYQASRPGINSFHIGFCTLAGKPPCSLPMVGVRRKRAKTSKEAYLPIVLEWIQTCNAEHSVCPKIADQLPSRVLDVGMMNDGTVPD